MPEYLGAPYAHSFTVGLSVAECLALIQAQHSRAVQTNEQNSQDLEIVVENAPPAEELVEFWLYAKRNSMHAFRRQKEVYGKIFLHGYGYRENHRTTVSYDFYHQHEKRWIRELISDESFHNYRILGYSQKDSKSTLELRLLLGLVMALISLWLVAGNMITGCLTTWFIWGVISIFLNIIFADRHLDAVIILDDLICDTFRHYAPGQIQQARFELKAKKHA